MTEVSHLISVHNDLESACECGHPYRYHNRMGLSENVIISPNCNACPCGEFREDKSTQKVQERIARTREEIESRKKEVQARLALIDSELSQLQDKCTHPYKKSQPEYDFKANWCDDCGAHWPT